MGSTALAIISEAYRHHNLDEITEFNSTMEFPYNLAKDVINQVIREMNRLGNYWFTETRTNLTYTAGVYQYSFNTLGVDPKRLVRIRKEANNQWGELTEYNWRHFQRLYRSSTITTANPVAFSKYGDTLELNSKPDQNYSLVAYHFKDMPLVSLPTDTFLIPERDEDVLIDCAHQLLGYKLGRWDLGTALQACRIKINPLLVDSKQDAGMPTQMPAAF